MKARQNYCYGPSQAYFRALAYSDPYPVNIRTNGSKQISCELQLEAYRWYLYDHETIFISFCWLLVDSLSMGSDSRLCIHVGLTMTIHMSSLLRQLLSDLRTPCIMYACIYLGVRLHMYFYKLKDLKSSNE